jgi:hypothetical protein
MRVRLFELRLIALGLTALWTLVAALVLLGYRPGGPVDLVVGLSAIPPAVISLAAVRWPPAARGDRTFPGIVWLGLGAVLLLVPSIADVARQLLSQGTQTLLPSAEAAYPWLLALAATSLFAGLGIARRSLGATSTRRTRLVRGSVVGLALTLATSGLFISVALANELALRDRPSLASRFGPTGTEHQPPTCYGAINGAATARFELRLTGNVDGKLIGNADLMGERAGSDVRWTAQVATDRVLGQFGAARVGTTGWRLSPRSSWVQAAAAEMDPDLVDRQATTVGLSVGLRATAEDRGLEFIEGARARHCRLSLDGPTFRRAFPQVTWLVGDADLHRWRGQLDFWVFGDGEVGRLAGTINGDTTGMNEGGLQGTVEATMIATDRDHPIAIQPPAG